MTVRRVAVVVFAGLLVFAIVNICDIALTSLRTTKTRQEVVGVRDSARAAASALPAATPAPVVDAPDVSVAPEPTMLPEAAALVGINPDYIGWLNIPGTIIDFPVVQTDDDVYYLHTDFYGKEWKRGTIFASAFSTNPTVLFGHHEDKMFQDLEQYKDPDFSADHLAISFGDLYGQRDYRVCAVYYFQNRQDLNGDGTADYEDYFGTGDPVGFLEFLETYDGTLYLDAAIDVSPASNFLSLQTCTYRIDGVPLRDGLLVVMAIEQPVAPTE